ncbi:MAG: hypothetical protein HQL69_18145 [Magnetococcales bacterium]|nr:hypothetical protein [Magnetococcales bacterium]
MKTKLLSLLLLGLAVFFNFQQVYAAPPTGHPSVSDAAKMLYIPAAKTKLPFRGRVLESFASNDYSYVRVLQDNKERWFAAPLVSLTPGMLVAFGKGTVMTNFYSRKWKRTFAEITFLNQMTPIAE